MLFVLVTVSDRIRGGKLSNVFGSRVGGREVVADTRLALQKINRGHVSPFVKGLIRMSNIVTIRYYSCRVCVCLLGKKKKIKKIGKTRNNIMAFQIRIEKRTLSGTNKSEHTA